MLERVETPSRRCVALLGLPWDEMSSHARGCAQAPQLIRNAMTAPSANAFSEHGRRNLGDEARLVDAGDVAVGAGPEALAAIEAAVGRVLDAGARVLSLGGDHAVTYPVLRAYALHYDALTIVQFDAHPDLYDDFEGNRFSHACPFARIMEEGLAKRLVQVGIRTMTAHQARQAERFAVEVIEMNDLDAAYGLAVDGPLYVSLDLDGLDPAFAPGVSHHEPGGMSTREVLRVLASIDAPLVGADVVEYNPTRDVDGVTAMVAAKFAKELAARMLDVDE